jgi:hypothetical protein
MNVNLEANFKEFSKHLRDFQRVHLPSIYRNVLTGIAYEAQRELKRNLPSQIHMPTPYTTKGIQVEKAEKDTLESKVGFVSKAFGKPPRGASVLPAEYMSLLNTGGVRFPKKKMIAVPVLKNYRPNKFGNIKGNDISDFLGDKDKYFSAKIDGKSGIWKRHGTKKKNKKTGKQSKYARKIKMMIAWEPKTKYSKTYEFDQVIKKKTRSVIKKEFAKHFKGVLQKKGAWTPFTTM